MEKTPLLTSDVVGGCAQQRQASEFSWQVERTKPDDSTKQVGCWLPASRAVWPTESQAQLRNENFMPCPGPK